MLEPGTRLGSYEIIAGIGSGGMGEVYRARDANLKRDVAVKVLPAALAHDRERLARFRREAEVLASLNHPGIATIYGLEGDAIVMELVAGETLTGPLPVETALRFARQIADALEYAHDRGVIHRDLKPANIKVTPEGSVKLLDFGLAKAIEDPLTRRDPSNSPTLTLGHTIAGQILGTAAYMSPEQAVGKDADRRSDIFSFGAVLYELLSGARAFTGESVGDVLAAVVKDDPVWSKLLAETPEWLRALLRRCLAKDRKQRLQAIGEARILFDSPPKLNNIPTATTVRSRRWGRVAAAMTVIAAVAVATWALWRSSDADLRPLIVLDVDLGSDVSLSQSSSGSRVIVSPDGARLAYYSGNPPRLFTRRLDQLDEQKATELPGAEEGDAPFFSPDSQWIGFIGNGFTKKVSVEGGAVISLANIGGPGASWAESGDIFVGLTRITPGGTAAPLIKRNTGASFGYVPQVLPGGKAVLFTTRKGVNDEESATVDVLSLMDGTTKTLVQGTTGRYVPSGHLLYINKGTLFAIPFDLNRLETYGDSKRILDDVARMPVTGTGQYDVSRDQHGTLVFLRQGEAEAEPVRTIQLLDTAGKKQTLIAKRGFYRGVHFSPDKKYLIYMEGRGLGPLGFLEAGQVFKWDLSREFASPLTPAGKSFRSPRWHPHGYVLLAAQGQGGVFWTRSDGAGEPQPLNAEDKRNLNLWSITSDGKWLAYTSGNAQIEIVPLSEENGKLKSGKPKLVTGNEPAFSPDGKWLAYSSAVGGAEGGRGRGRRGQPDGTQLYVQAFRPELAGEPTRVPIANNGGQVKWLPDGRTLIFRSGDQIMAVDYTVKGDEFSPGKQRVWIDKLGGTIWDLDPRASNRVAVVTADAAPTPPKPQHEVVLLLNFFDYLRQKVPVR